MIEPLHLTGTSWPGGFDLPFPHPRGYVTTKAAELDQVDYTDLDPNIAGAAGSLVSTTTDLASFLRALTHNRVVSTDAVTLMTTPFDQSTPFRYGLGVQTITPPCRTNYIGHYGAIPGFTTLAATTPDGRRQVVIMLTNGSDTTPALELAVNALVERALCPPG